jgi:hypothetical protein
LELLPYNKTPYLIHAKEGVVKRIPIYRLSILTVFICLAIKLGAFARGEAPSALKPGAVGFEERLSER